MPDLITVTATAQQALAMGRRPTAEATVQTHRHVPGSVLRGALAAAWLTEYGEPDPERPGRATIPAGMRTAFAEIFEGPIRFGPLMIPGSGVVPLSVLRCKYPKPGKQCASLAWDTAFVDPPPEGRCEDCEGPLEAGRGEVERVDKRVLSDSTRVALTQDETAQEGLLFTRQALRPTATKPLVLTGQIAAIRGDIPQWLTRPRQVLLGGRRSTGGATDLTAAPAQPMAPALTDRLVLRLLSSAILVDQAGRPVHQPDINLLSLQLGVRVGPITRSWTRTTTIGGWHAAADLPKPDDLAMAAGSVFELPLPDGPPPAERLTALLLQGIGLRRTEGYGWIEIATAPWQPPPSAATGTSADTSAPNQVLEGARVLFASGHGRWLRDELRHFLATWHRHDTRPDQYLLDRPTIEQALHQQPFRQELTDLLTAGTPDRIRQTIDALETLIRGTP